MLLNSYHFIFFFIALFFIYWRLAKTNKTQNIILLIGSYVFFASWSYQFILLIFGTSVATYFIGKQLLIAKDTKKKWWLRLGVLVVLGQLIYFKYTNFFIENFNDLLKIFHSKGNISTLQYIIPIGISFYSFRMLGYLLDIKNRKLKESKSLLEYLVYVAFFPCIIAGPIDRSFVFLNQLKEKRIFNATLFSLGLRQILWGLFKKLVIADQIAVITTELFSKYEGLNGSALFVGMILYFIQLYADFSGYSDMAIGIGKLLGINVQKNFNFPFFAQNVADYWRRWHISLTSWVTDYVFTPLSIQFRDYGKFGLILAIIINFIIIGFWHGAEWHYIFHGLLSGIMFIPLILGGKMGKKIKPNLNILPTFREAKNMIITFISFALLQVLFFSKSLEMALHYYKGIFSLSFFQKPNFQFQRFVAILIIFMMAIEWLTRNQEFPTANFLDSKPRIVRWGFYYVLVFLIFLFYLAPKGYIYAQF